MACWNPQVSGQYNPILYYNQPSQVSLHGSSAIRQPFDKGMNLHFQLALQSTTALCLLSSREWLNGEDLFTQLFPSPI